MNVLTVISFLVEPFDGGQRAAFSVTPLFDGVPLIRLVEDFERTHQFDKIGGHAGIVPRNYRFGPLNCHFLPELFGEDLYGDWKITGRYLLGCNCGEVGCWPLTASISETDVVVTWDTFYQPHLPSRDYSAFGPFHFDFDQYREAVNEVAEQFYENDAEPRPKPVQRAIPYICKIDL